ncbi:DUF6460 domain-containing protein [Chthonobacter rhizosphaerae]|uniref:DUF6460 domain-containing protein n=1 Tax=Chthonobacter rhizosphaerae TaxID=2735553 RepID=UPI0015EF7DDD|nr:DUF6460 domain-containing protein [Chthonobacter rhizosphaerae]
MSTLTRFLGDSPLRVLVRLVFLSFLVGVVMAAIGLEPLDLVNSAIRFVEDIWETGFQTIERAMRYLLLGAVIVVPIFILMRLMRMGGRG